MRQSGAGNQPAASRVGDKLVAASCIINHLLQLYLLLLLFQVLLLFIIHFFFLFYSLFWFFIIVRCYYTVRTCIIFVLLTCSNKIVDALLLLHFILLLFLLVILLPFITMALDEELKHLSHMARHFPPFSFTLSPFPSPVWTHNHPRHKLHCHATPVLLLLGCLGMQYILY